MTIAFFLLEMGVLFGALRAAGLSFGFEAGPLARVFATALPLFCCAAGFSAAGLYDLQPSANETGLVRRIGRGLAIAAMLLLGLYLAAPELRPHASLVLSTGIVLAVAAAFSLPLHWVVQRVLGSEAYSGRVLILGTSPLALKVAHAIRETRHGEIVGFLEESESPSRRPVPGPILGPLSSLAQALTRTQPDRIIVALSERRNRLPTRELLAARAKGVNVEGGIRAYERITGKLAIESLTPSYLVFSDDFRISAWSLWAKRATSLAFGATALLLSLPLFPLIALAVKRSKGPVFFVHERVGKDGRPFRLYKFRTMRESDSSVSEWEKDNEARITPEGHFLRKFRLDELPQFWNILKGDMNFVGPRPHPVSNYELFIREIPYYSLRQSIPPGLTGWAQVRNGYAQDLDGEIEKMRYDLFYISHLSIWMDLKILLKTIKVVVSGKEDHVADLVDAPTPAVEADRTAAA